MITNNFFKLVSCRIPRYASKFIEMCLMITADHGPGILYYYRILYNKPFSICFLKPKLYSLCVFIVIAKKFFVIEYPSEHLPNIIGSPS